MKIGKETELLEFKKTTAELKEGVISIASILNKHGGGELIFGVLPNGVPAGQMVSEKTLRDISQAISNHIEPKIYPNISEVYINDKSCISVVFIGDEPPYFAYGRAYIRVADEDKVMSPAELEDYILRKNARTDTWDRADSGKNPDDINESIIKDYHERANQTGRIDFSYKSKKDTLARLGMLNNKSLTNAAAVFFSSMPLIEVQMAIFAGVERLTFIDIQREGGSVQELAAIAERYIRKHIKWRVILDGSLQRKEIPEIPMDAIREAIINSFCHKNFKSSQNNTISIFSNRIEIYNPGTFPDGLTPEDFIEGGELSIKRNPLLAQLMYYVKDIESFGTGLKRITDACNTAGVKVEFKMLKLGFAVVFYRSELNDNEGLNDKLNDKLNDNENQLIINFIKQQSTISTAQAAQVIGRSHSTARRILIKLVNDGIIDFSGKNKNRVYFLKS